MKPFPYIILGIMLASTAPQAEETSARVLTGGVGEGSAQAIQNAQEDYTLKLVFTGAGGAYLANVDVTIEDKKGDKVVNGIGPGPLLLADLEPGRYTVTAEADGFQEKRTVSVGKSLKTYHIRFPVRDEDTLSLRDSLEADDFQVTMFFKG